MTGGRTARVFGLTAAFAVIAAAALHAQGRGGGPPAPPTAAKAAAPVDFTGYWVSIIVDEWRFRVTPQKGDILYLPLNAEARRIADAWDPAKDQADGNECRAYGAVGVMQRPGRLHVTWEDDNTLRLDADAGTQTRRWHFGTAPSQPGAPTWQGYSVAHWDTSSMPRGFGQPAGTRQPDTLIVTTTNMLPGYVRKNGVPYSGNALLTEYVNRLMGADGQLYLAVTAMVDDPAYLNQPFIRTYTFKKLPDASGWDPTPCWAR